MQAWSELASPTAVRGSRRERRCAGATERTGSSGRETRTRLRPRPWCQVSPESLHWRWRTVPPAHARTLARWLVGVRSWGAALCQSRSSRFAVLPTLPRDTGTFAPSPNPRRCAGAGTRRSSSATPHRPIAHSRSWSSSLRSVGPYLSRELRLDLGSEPDYSLRRPIGSPKAHACDDDRGLLPSKLPGSIPGRHRGDRRRWVTPFIRGEGPRLEAVNEAPLRRTSHEMRKPAEGFRGLRFATRLSRGRLNSRCAQVTWLRTARPGRWCPRSP